MHNPVDAENARGVKLAIPWRGLLFSFLAGSDPFVEEYPGLALFLPE